MSCAACSARVEKAVSALPGLTSCSVNLLTGSLIVEGSVSEEAIRNAVETAGYGFSASAGTHSPQSRPTSSALRRLILSVIFLLPLSGLSMGPMFGLALPKVFSANPLAVAWLEAVLAGAVLIVHRRYFSGGFRALLNGSSNMDTLVALGSGVSFVYSLILLVAMTIRKDKAVLSVLYFDSAAMILVLISVGKLLEANAKGKTTNALKGLLDLSPETALVLRNGVEITVPSADLCEEELFVVKPGDRFPADGVVIAGSGSVNESSLTGESLPVDKEPGNTVSAGTINQDGFMTCRATKVGSETLLSQIIQMVSDATATKAPIAKTADRVAGIFVPAVLGIAVLTIAAWLIAGKDAGFALARGISVLVISCPCAMGLATPVAIMVGAGIGAKKGILFKTAEALENAGKASIAVLDKTGTVTQGEPAVVELHPEKGISEEKLLRLAASVEQFSDHPLAKAVTHLALAIEKEPAIHFKACPGNGLFCEVNGLPLRAGKESYLEQYVSIPEESRALAKQSASKGHTILYYAYGAQYLGWLATSDRIKPESAQAVRELKGLGLRVLMVTGDREEAAREICAKAGIDEYRAGVLPGEKERIVRELQQQGFVLMIGDGINDAPALTRANTGIAINTGANIAVDAADVVLMDGNLLRSVAALRLSRFTLRTIRQNLFWAFFYNLICIPLAAGAWIPITGWEMSPMIGAFCMSLSSFCVILNALRLNLVDIHSSRKDHSIKVKKENRTMKKTMKISGMMCSHCSGRVQAVLEALPQVVSAIVSHETGSAEVTLNTDVSNAILKETVEAQGYQVTDIQ